MVKNIILLTSFFIFLILLVIDISQSSDLRIGYEIDMRTKTISVKQNIFIDYRLSEKYRIGLVFNDVDLNKNKLDTRVRLYYTPRRNEQILFTIGKDVKSLAYFKRIQNYELEFALAKKKR